MPLGLQSVPKETIQPVKPVLPIEPGNPMVVAPDKTPRLPKGIMPGELGELTQYGRLF